MGEEKPIRVVGNPDDQVLGYGGTIAKSVDAGAEVHVAFLADGVYSRSEGTQDELKRRRTAARSACNVLGVHSIEFANYPDSRMESVPFLEITKSIKKLIDQYQPDTIYKHHAGDINIGYSCIHQTTIPVCTSQRRYPAKTLLLFEVASSTERRRPGSGTQFPTNWFVDISGAFQSRLTKLDAYAEETLSWPHPPRSINAVEMLARPRGATIGGDAAEAIVLRRCLL